VDNRWASKTEFKKSCYLSADEIDENVVFRFEPSPFTKGIMARAMPVAMRPYSIAVAADSSFRKALIFGSIAAL
jgi:hypothetical protein